LRAAAADKVVLFIHVIQDDTSLTFILARMYAGNRLCPLVFHAATVFARLKSFFGCTTCPRLNLFGCTTLCTRVLPLWKNSKSRSSFRVELASKDVKTKRSVQGPRCTAVCASVCVYVCECVCVCVCLCVCARESTLCLCVCLWQCDKTA